MKIKEGKLEKMGMAKNNPRGFERQKSDLKKTFDARILYEICWEFCMGISLIIAFMMTMRNQILKSSRDKIYGQARHFVVNYF